MNFLEAVKAMKEGKKVRRPAMSPVVGLLISDGFPQYYGLHGDSIYREIAIELIEATDWEIVEERKTLSDKGIENYYFGNDVKEALKEFIEYILCPDKIDFRKGDVRNKAKAIFGDRLCP